MGHRIDTYDIIESCDFPVCERAYHVHPMRYNRINKESGQVFYNHQQAIHTFLSIVIKAIFYGKMDDVLTHIVLFLFTDGVIIDIFHM